MFRRTRSIAFVAAFAAATALLFAYGPRAQEQGEMPSLATAEHRWLAEEAGVWKATCTWHGPGGKVDFEGEETVTVDCGGLWVFTRFTADFAGMPFQGRSVIGFDPESKKVHSAWVDAMNTRIMRLEGSIEGESVVLMTEGTDPMTGETFPEKHVQTRKGKDERHLKMIALRDGEEHVLMEIAYARKK